MEDQSPGGMDMSISHSRRSKSVNYGHLPAGLHCKAMHTGSHHLNCLSTLLESVLAVSTSPSQELGRHHAYLSKIPSRCALQADTCKNNFTNPHSEGTKKLDVTMSLFPSAASSTQDPQWQTHKGSPVCNTSAGT